MWSKNILHVISVILNLVSLFFCLAYDLDECSHYSWGEKMGFWPMVSGMVYKCQLGQLDSECCSNLLYLHIFMSPGFVTSGRVLSL